MSEIFKELGTQFERTSGQKIVPTFDTTPNLIKQATSGVPFDLGVVPADVLKDDAARRRFASGPTTDIARVGWGVAVRAGAPKPDISSPQALRQTLIKAQSVTFIPESAAGAQILKTFDHLGIREAMQAKTKTQAVPAQIPEAVANGDAELGLFLVNVLTAPGVDLVGPFPPELAQELVFTAAVSADTAQAPAARGFINYMKTPEAVGIIRARGMKPA